MNKLGILKFHELSFTFKQSVRVCLGLFIYFFFVFQAFIERTVDGIQNLKVL